MAESVVDIILRIRDDAGKVITKTVKDLSDLKAATDKLDGGGVSKLGSELNKVKPAASESATSLQALAGVVGGLAPGLEAAVIAFRRLSGAIVAVVSVAALKNLADVAAQIQVTGTVLRVVAGNAGFSTAAVTKLDKEIQGLGITAKDSADSLTKFIQAGLGGIRGESLGKAKELARAAQDLAVVTGENSSQTFSRLITNIQQMDTMGLRFMGLTVDRQKAEEKYAQSIGKTAGALSDTERRQAVMNAALVEAAKLAGTYEEAMGDAAKQLTSLPRLYNEIAAPISEVLQPAYSALILTWSEFLKEAKKIVVAWRESTDGGLAFGDAVKKVAGYMKDAAVFLLKHADAIILVAKAWLTMKVMGTVIGLFTPMMIAITGATGALSLLRGAIVAVANVVLTRLAPAFFTFVAIPITGAISAITAGFAAMTVGGGGLAGVLTGVRVALLGLMTALGPLAIAIGVVSVAWAAFSGAFKSKDQKLFDAAQNEKELNKMVEDMVEARSKMTLAREKANKYTGDDKQEKEALDKLAKEAEAEYKIAKIRTDRFVKERGLQKEVLEATDRQKQAEYEIKQAIASTTAQLDAMKEARQRLGIADKDGITDAAKFDQVVADFDKVYKATLAATVQIAETSEQMIHRVISSGVVSVSELEEAVRKSGLTTEEYIQKFYPPPDRLSSWQGLQAAISKGGDEAKKAFAEMSQGFDQLLSEAKSPERIAVALDQVGKYAEVMGTRVLAAKETLTFNREKQELDRLNSALAGYANTLTTLKGAMETYSSITSDTANAQSKWQEVMRGLGGSFQDVGGQVIKVTESLKTFADSSGANSSATAANTARTLSELRQRYDLEEQAARASAARKRQLAAELPGGEAEQAARIKAIDTETLAQRLEAAKRHYGSLKQLRDEALNNYKTYAELVKGLDQKLFNLREEKESKIRDIRRKGMTEEEANSDRLREYEELLSKSKEASQKKAYDKAAEYARKAAELAGQAGLDPAAEARKVEEAYEAQEQALEKQRAEAKKMAEEQLNAAKEVAKSVNDLAATITSLTQEQVVALKPTLDEDNLKTILQRVKDEFEQLQINVKVNADTGATQGFAVGGMVRGPGTETSDSILAALSKNEFVHTARAVRHYGADFMYALNSMSLPRNMARSLMSGTIPRFAAGGLVRVPTPVAQSSGSVMALDLSFNSRPLGRVSGSRDTIHALVGALKEVSRGT